MRTPIIAGLGSTPELLDASVKKSIWPLILPITLKMLM